MCVCVCVCLFQYNICNQTGSPHLDLFPLNNETLQVDIYKGVRLKRSHVGETCDKELLTEKDHQQEHLQLLYNY